MERPKRVGPHRLGVGSGSAEPVAHGRGGTVHDRSDGAVAEAVPGGKQGLADGLDGVEAVRVGDQVGDDVAASTRGAAAASVADGDDAVDRQADPARWGVAPGSEVAGTAWGWAGDVAATRAV